MATQITLSIGGEHIPLTVCEGPGTGPAVVVIPSIFGIADDLVQQMQEVADRGATVLIVDPFWRVEPKGPMTYKDPGAALQRLGTIETARSFGDFLAAVGHGKKVGNGKVLGLGICFGGPFAFMAAAAGQLHGVVTWHGSRLDNFLGGAKNITCPLRLHFGEKDPVVPMRTVELLRTTFSAHPDCDIQVHAGAGHGFSHRSASAYNEVGEAAGMAAVHELVAGAT